MISVALIDDHTLIREGLQRAISRTAGMDVGGEAASVAEGRALINKQPFEAMIVDVKLPDGDGRDLIPAFRRRNPTSGVVVLTMYGGDEHLLQAKSAGASGFVAKGAPASEVIAAVRRAVERPNDFTADGLADALRRHGSNTAPQLTRREREVLDLLGEGLGIAAISRRLFISESTTKTHVAKIYAKLGVTNRAGAIMAAVRLGLIEATQ